MSKKRTSTGSKPETMGGDGLTGPDQQPPHDLDNQDVGMGNSTGSQDQARPEQRRKDTARRAQKKIPERLRRLKDPDRIED
jgi:hypothetical protein